MSARFWLFSMACAGVALGGGLGLGRFATTAPRAGTVETGLPIMEIGEGSATPEALTGPMQIDCRGCGPTLADRRMAADLAAWDGAGDREVQAYEADDLEEAEAVPPPVTPVVQRLATSAQTGSFEPIRVVRIIPPQNITSAGEIPADVISSD